MSNTPQVRLTRLDAAIRTDIGPRDRNEDSAVASESFLLVADGVGGAPAGHHAAATVTEAVARMLRTRDQASPMGDKLAVSPIGDVLTMAFQDAHISLAGHVGKNPCHDGLATTLSAAVIDHAHQANRVIAAWVGDSPIWHVRPHSSTPIRRLGGDPTGPEGRLSTWLSNTTHHLPRLASAIVEPGDWIVVASDGVQVISEDQIVALIREYEADCDPAQVASALIEAVVSESSIDNATVAMGRVVHPGERVQSPTAPCAIDREWEDQSEGPAARNRPEWKDLRWWRG